MNEPTSLPTLASLRKRYEEVAFTGLELVNEFNLLADQLRLCFQTSEEEGSKKDLNERLLRHYVSEGLISPPEKVSGENRFRFQHLMELLALRRLQTDGRVTLKGLRDAVCGWPLEALHHVLDQGMHLRVEPGAGLAGNEDALRAIREIRRKTRGGEGAAFPGQRPDARTGSGQWWERHLLAPGLEIGFSEDFDRPMTLHEEHRLIEQFRERLRRRKRRRSGS